jgi:hypothetical protein
MFAPPSSSWSLRIRRAAALVKAFVLLEDPPRSAATTALIAPGRSSGPRPAADLPTHVVHAHAQRTHPHRLPLAAARRVRRPGAVPAPAAACTMPVGRRTPRVSTAHVDR